MFFNNHKYNLDSNKKTLIFDFDGTIADTFEHLIDIVDQYMGDFGVEIADKNLLQELRGMSANDVFKRFKIPKFIVPFVTMKIQNNMSKRIKQIQPFEQVLNEISKIKNDYNIGVLSTNSQKNLDTFLKVHNLQDLFKFVVAERNIFGKDKVLNKIITNNNLDKNNVLYIGDEVRDVVACNKVGIKVLSVSWGFNNTKILNEYNKHVLEDQSKLTQTIDSMFK